MPKKRTGPSGMKAAAARQPKVALKAERIQAFLRKFPKWRLRGKGRTLVRVYRFPGPASALAYFKWLAVFCQDYGRPARIDYAGGTVVTVVLPQRSANGLTPADLTLARRLEMRG